MQKGAFTTTRWSHDRDEFSTLDFDIHSSQGWMRGCAALIGFCKPDRLIMVDIVLLFGELYRGEVSPARMDTTTAKNFLRNQIPQPFCMRN